MARDHEVTGQEHPGWAGLGRDVRVQDQPYKIPRRAGSLSIICFPSCERPVGDKHLLQREGLQLYTRNNVRIRRGVQTDDSTGLH